MKYAASRYLILGVMAVLAAGLGAWAQTDPVEKKIIHAQARVAEAGKHLAVVYEGAAAQGATFTFIASEMDFETKVVKGAPFSADTVTEFTQMLSNGQRIYRRTNGAIYRDSEGRTRKEQTIGAIGSYASSDPAQQTIIINDPVAGLIYILNPESRMAMRNEGGSASVVWHAGRGEAAGASGGVVAGTSHVTVTGGGGAVVASGGVAGTAPHVSVSSGSGGGGVFVAKRQAGPSPNTRTEALGLKMISGIQAEGTRTVETIPAGSIGNDAPIEIVSERWYSPELQIVVRTVHNDPRSGENVYQLNNIRRGDPPGNLFQVPADYVVKEGPMQQRTIRIQKKDGGK